MRRRSTGHHLDVGALDGWMADDDDYLKIKSKISRASRGAGYPPPTTIRTAPTTAAGVLEVSTPMVTAPWNTVLLPVAMPTMAARCRGRVRTCKDYS